jgi:hypothetical protein
LASNSNKAKQPIINRAGLGEIFISAPITAVAVIKSYFSGLEETR